jgi:hypothetical protein
MEKSERNQWRKDDDDADDDSSPGKIIPMMIAVAVSN